MFFIVEDFYENFNPVRYQKIENRGYNMNIQHLRYAVEVERTGSITQAVGTAFNPAHEEIMYSLQLKTRNEAIETLKEILSEMGKEIKLEIY